MRTRSSRDLGLVFLPRLIFISALAVACAKGKTPSTDGGQAAPPAPVDAPTPAPVEPPSPPYDGRDGGLFPTDSQELPKGVRDATKSVFRIYVPIEQGAEDVDLTYFKGSEYLASIAKLRATDLVKTAIRNQAKACLARMGVTGRLGLGDTTCRIAKSFAVGTGFLTADGKMLWTSLQTLKRGVGFLENMESGVRGEKSTTAWPIFIFDGEGRLVFDSLKEKVQPAYIPANADKQYYRFLRVPSEDYLAIELPRALGPALAIATALPSQEDRIFSAGFPSCTGCRKNETDLEQIDRSPYPNSDGYSMRVSIGHLTEKPDIAKIMSLNFAEQYEFSDFPLLCASMDGTSGFSGAPVLNEKGEVVGMVTTTLANSDGESVNRRVILLRPMTTPFIGVSY